MRHSSLSYALLLSLGLSSSASAIMVSGVYSGHGANEQSACAYKHTLLWDSTASVNYSNIRLAEQLWTLGDGTTAVTWCVQVYQGVTEGNAYVFEVVPMELVPQMPPQPGPMGFAKAAVLSDAMFRWLNADSSVIASAGNANSAAAAFNALVWEVVNENFNTNDLATIVSRMSLQTGAFRSNLSAQAVLIYDTMVASLGQGGFQTTNTEGWLNASAQDQIRMAPVPAPGAIALAAVGGLGLRRRRR